MDSVLHRPSQTSNRLPIAFRLVRALCLSLGTRLAPPGRLIPAISTLSAMVTLALLCADGVQQIARATPLDPDRAHDTMLVQSSVLPEAGPHRALVTVEVSGTFGRLCPAPVLAVLWRRVSGRSDVRLRFVPQSANLPTAELILAACETQPSQCFPLLIELCAHPEWFDVSAPGVFSDSVLAATERYGFSATALQDAVQTHRFLRRLRQLWAQRPPRFTPEVTVNGRRLSGPRIETIVLDEIDRERRETERDLQAGIPLSQVFSRRANSIRSISARPFGSVAPNGLSASSFHLSVDLTRRPCTGPAVPLATMVYVFHQEGYQDGLNLQTALSVHASFRETVRLCVLHAPSVAGVRWMSGMAEMARKTADRLAQLAQTDPVLYFAFLTEISSRTTRGFVREADVLDFLRRHNKPPTYLDPPTQGKALVSADISELTRLGLTPASQIILNGRLLHSYSPQSLSAALSDLTKTGFLARLKKNSLLPP